MVALIVGFACWLYTKVKSIQKQLNRHNNRVPDITVLRKIVPVSVNNGWKVFVLFSHSQKRQEVFLIIKRSRLVARAR